MTPPAAEADRVAGAEWLLTQLSDGERLRLVDARRDWRDADWQDHCGDPLCESCHGWADSHTNTLTESDDPEGFAVRALLMKGKEG